MKMPSSPLKKALLLAVAVVVGLGLGCGCELLKEPTNKTGDFHTTVYLSEAEALKVVFPDAAKIVREDLLLSAEELQSAAEKYRRPLRQSRYRAFLGARPDGELDGYAVIQSEVGKFKPFTFIVGVDPDGKVRRVAVLVYRESRGREVTGRRFLVQYPGKSLANPISKNADIINIEGATMSVDALNRGVRKVLAVVEVAYRGQPERVRSLLDGEGLTAVAQPRPESDESRECQESGKLHEVREARRLMGTLCEIRAFGRDRAHVRQAIASAFAEIEAVEAALSDYRAESELSQVSAAAGQPVPISELTAEFLQAGRRVFNESRGAFDLTVGPLIDAWGFRYGPRRVPATKMLEELRPRLGFDKVVLEVRAEGLAGQSRSPWSVRLARPGMRLDPGGLGKGFAVDRAVAKLAALGIRAALVDFSSTVFALGTPPHADAWGVAVRDPERPKRVLCQLRLRDQALAASGAYGKFFEVGGTRYGHILSPLTLRPVEGVSGAVILAPSATRADGHATAAAVLGSRAIPLLEELDGVEGLLVLHDGVERVRTSGWPVDTNTSGHVSIATKRVHCDTRAAGRDKAQEL